MVEILFVQPYSTEFPFFQHVGELVPQERQHLLARVDTELSTGTRNLPVDGAYGKAQTVGDVSVRIALNHIAQDFGNRLALLWRLDDKVSFKQTNGQRPGRAFTLKSAPLGCRPMVFKVNSPKSC